jgi:phosphoribosylformylglycinamidine synthase
LFDLRAIPLDQSGLSAAEIWCNESQERFVLAVAPQNLATVQYFARRERCPIAVVGTATDDGWLRVQDARSDAPTPVSMPMQVLLGKPPKMHREAASRSPDAIAKHDLDCSGIDLTDMVTKVLSHPSVGSKSFLITIGDRTVGGLCHRDPMVGPWQVPVADCGVGLVDFDGVAGEALAIGERTPLALLNPAAASRMAIGEAITNLASAGDVSLKQVKLSANWMAPTGSALEDGDLLSAVQAASDLCLAVGLSIPVGKDSLSMRSRWGHQEVKSPVSLLVTALGPLSDVRQGATPVLRLHADSSLLLIDLGQGQKRMGASILAQVQDLRGGVPPDLDDPSNLPKLIEGLKALRKAGLLWAYHDRSDGGLLACLAEMAFASHCGLSINLDMLTIDPFAADWGDFKIRPDQVSVQRNELTIKALFNEELGVVIQVPADRRNEALGLLREAGLSRLTHVIGKPNERDVIEFYRDAKQIASFSRAELHSVWSTTSAAMASLRDEPGCVQAEFEKLATDEGKLSVALSFNASDDIAAPMIARGIKPRVAILREQGVNGQVEMAAAFDRAGFEPFDVHMSDLLEGRHRLKDFQALAACGGFSYGDVLGAGSGWARSVLFNAKLAQEFSEFFQRPDTLSLGVCNGCQMLSQLKALIPGAQAWPRFVRNRSEQYEGRLVMVEVTSNPSPWVSGMAGSKLPIVVAHGEGQAHFASPAEAHHARGFLRFVDGAGQATEAYPMNPNGSPGGWTGFTSDDGRAAILMPHPERVFRTLQMSWAPWQQTDAFEEATGWLRLFRNARVALG